MSTDNELFKANLERWKVFQPFAAPMVEVAQLNTVSIGLNENGIETNLFKEINGQKFPLYSPSDINLELQQWHHTLNSSSFNILFVYGIGLGYYYASMKEWLVNNPKAFIVFLEDDLEVIKAFLGTELATVFLHDPQARLYYFNPETDQDRLLFHHLGVMAVLEQREKSALFAYRALKPQLFAEFSGKLDYHCQKTANIVNEYVQYSLGFQKNFFENMFELPGAYSATKMFGSFKNVPAIICGAGPSLAKNIDLLKQLNDKALIIAGGTAINALNAKSLNPHFGAGIDPNSYQYTRLIANQAFETPFFYRSRILNNALKTVHGDHLYVSGTGGHLISDWFEKELGIEGYALEEGHNVVNMSVSLAKALGCNPIILVGVDLAYSNNENYSSGIQSHAIHDRRANFFTKNKEEELITKKDIYGQPVNTLWKWINESVWFGVFAKENPQITLINATEGGIGFPEVANMTLAEVAEKYLKTSYDFPTIIHRSLQRATLPVTIDSAELIRLMKKLEESLDRCYEFYDQLIVAWKAEYVNILGGERTDKDSIPPKVLELLERLKGEDAWNALLKIYNAAYFPILYSKQEEIDFNKNFKDEQTVALARADFFIKSNEFLKTACRLKKYLINEISKIYLEKNKQIPQKGVSTKTTQLKETLAKDHAPETDVEIREDKTIDGRVLSRSSYLHNKRHGKSWFYYADKSLKCVERYKNGVLEGFQEYYYPNSNLKTVLKYSNGLLEGEQLLFHKNGKLYRELHFKAGKREGIEKLWNEAGIQLLEANYSEGKPIGTAREWYPNGNVAREIIYHQDPSLNKTRVWDSNGAPQEVDRVKKNDYFDNLTQQTSKLTESLENIFQSLSGVAKNVKMEVNPYETTIQQDIDQVQKEITHLHDLNKEMIFESGLDPENTMEQIWKTPSAQRGMESYLNDVTKKMTDDLNSIQNALSLALGLLAENPVFENPTHDKNEDDKEKKTKP